MDVGKDAYLNIGGELFRFSWRPNSSLQYLFSTSDERLFVVVSESAVKNRAPSACEDAPEGAG